MEILWTTAFIDMAENVFEAGATFWQGATRSTRSPMRGETEQFATLLPGDGDPYLRVQRTDDGTTGIHLDLHVEAPDTAAEQAVALGASVVADHGYFIMSSPSGFVFCFVSNNGEAATPAPVATPHPHTLDQLCIDIAPRAFDAECAFWADLTGWDLADSQLAEFRSLTQPAVMPLRFLLQRLDEAPTDHSTHAHLDVACGDYIDSIAAAHVAAGAQQLGRTKLWMQMRDPAGLDYCLTPRQPRLARSVTMGR